MWRGYVERRNVHDEGRKREGVAARLDTSPVAVLESPDEVADWVTGQLAQLGKDADQWAQEKNGLVLQPANVLRSTARKQSSVYATVRASRDEVWDVCAEIVADDSCPAGPGGHTFAEVKGVWRCTRCGKSM